MGNNLRQKTSNTTLRVGKLLLALLDAPMSYSEIFKYFDEKLDTSVYTTEALKKYLNTLCALGLRIEKIKSKFHLLNFLVQINLNQTEINAFNDIEKSVLKYGTDKNIKTMIDIKRKMIKFFDTKSQKGINNYVEQSLTTKIGLLIKQFEKLCDDGQKIKIEYDNKIVTVEPKQVLYFENKVYLEFFNLIDLKIKKIELEKIKLIEQQPNKNTNIEISNFVVFELFNELANIYKLKDGEIILEKKENSIVIKSTNDDYEFLAKKIARYKNNCKIIAPLEFKKYFVDYMKNILKRYE